MRRCMVSTTCPSLCSVALRYLVSRHRGYPRICCKQWGGTGQSGHSCCQPSLLLLTQHFAHSQSRRTCIHEFSGLFTRPHTTCAHRLYPMHPILMTLTSCANSSYIMLLDCREGKAMAQRTSILRPPVMVMPREGFRNLRP